MGKVCCGRLGGAYSHVCVSLCVTVDGTAGLLHFRRRARLRASRVQEDDVLTAPYGRIYGWVETG